MCDSKQSTQMIPKVKLVDVVSVGDVSLGPNIKECRDMGAHAHKEFSNDDVFKGLVNIVMDVFSKKSEKCKLKFVLPEESDILTEMSNEEIVENSSNMSVNASKSDILIPLKKVMYSTKSLKKRKRKFSVPSAKKSKYNHQKTLKKTLNPIVQTALYPGLGDTNLERGFWINRSQQGHSNKDHSNQHMATDFSGKKAIGWKDKAERDALLTEASSLKENNQPQTDSTDEDAYNNLYSKFKSVVEEFGNLAHLQIQGRMSFGEFLQHAEEIHSHLEAMRTLLNDSTSSAATALQVVAGAKSCKVSKRKKKVGLKLIRIGAKISQKSSIKGAALSKKPSQQTRYKQKMKNTRNGDLNGILRNYQRLKKEETEIVQNLLGKLGFQDNLNPKCKKGRSKTKGEEFFGKLDVGMSPNSNLTEEIFQLGDVVQNSNLTQDWEKEAIRETQKELINLICSSKPKELKKMTVIEHNNDQKQRENHKRKNGISRKHHGHRKKSREVTTEKSRDYGEIMNECCKKYPSRIIHTLSSPVLARKRLDIVRHPSGCGKRSAANFMEIQSHREIISTVDRMMHEMRSAAERLQFMRDLLEKKLNRLSKQQKVLRKKVTGKSRKEYYVATEIQSIKESQNFVYDQPEGLLLNLSTKIEESSLPPRRSFELEGFNNFKFASNFHMNDPPNAEVSEDRKPYDSQCDTQQLFLSHSIRDKCNQHFDCNFIIEPLVKEFELTSSGSMGNQPGSGNVNVEKVFTSTILTNEFQEPSSSNGHDKDLPASSLLLVSAKENEGEIMEESLFATPLPSKQNALETINSKKKKRVIQTPSCSMS